jgi:hypothetical protein
MDMDFWFSIFIIAFELIAVMAYIIYFVADHAHPEDTELGKSWFMRITIFLGMLCAYTSMLMVQADVLFSSHLVSHGVVEWMWAVVVFCQISFVYIVAPLVLVYYSSNENEPFGRRIFKSVRAQLPLLVCLALLVVPTYFSPLSSYNLPADIATEYGVPAEGKTDFLLHTYCVTAWLGMMFFAFFAGVGLVMMPVDLLFEFIYRPNPITERDFNRRKNYLLPLVIKQRTEVKRLDKERFHVENM